MLASAWLSNNFFFLESGGESIPFVPRVRFPDPASYAGWVCWFSTLLWQIFPSGTPVLPRVFRFSPDLKKPTFYLIWVNFNLQCPQLVLQCWKTWHINTIPLLNFLYGFTNRAVFNWLSKVIPWLRILRFVIGSRLAPVFPIQFNSKTRASFSTNETQNESQSHHVRVIFPALRASYR